MEKGLKELLESEVLSEATKTALSEAWNAKLAEVKESLRDEVTTQVHEEFTLRYSNDKANLVEAMDHMLTDAVKQYATESAEATKALKEERSKLSEAIKEARADYKSRLAQHTKMVEAFVLNQLKTELAEISEDHVAIQAQRVQLATEISEAKATYDAKLEEHKAMLNTFVLGKLNENVNSLKAQEQALAESKVSAAKKLREHRVHMNEQTAARINKLEGFVLEHMTKELRELEEDRNKLVETRARCVLESKQKLDETKKAFIARASKLVETTVESHLRREMTQLKEDIRAARENVFGRRMFEAFQAEFMTSYLSEGSQVKKVMAELNEARAELAQANTKLNESAEKLNVQKRRVIVAEETAVRVNTLNELLAPLSNEKKAVMQELLRTVKTPALKESFTRYLPTVLNETKANQGRRVLSETAPVIEPKTIAVTGDRKNRLAESARAEDDQSQGMQNAEILNLRRLAGLEH
jgi:hypothetical protein